MKPPLTIGVSVILGFVLGYFYALPNEQENNSPQKIIETAKTKQSSIQLTSIPPTSKKVSHGESSISSEKIRKLSGELSKAKDTISSLQKMNENLETQIEQLNLPISSSMTYPDLVDKIDKLPISFINNQLGYLFDKETINQLEDSRAFSKRLLEVALEESDDNNQSDMATIAFSKSPAYGIRMIEQNIEVNAGDSIFAHILPNETLEEFIVKWQYQNTGEILLFKKQTILPNKDNQYVWLRPKKGWQPGVYTVSIYSMDDSVSPIAVNSYNIVSVAGGSSSGELSVNTRNEAIIQEMLSSGQAVPSIPR